jgi:succinyl-diaminopimelate desuccinylase
MDHTLRDELVALTCDLIAFESTADQPVALRGVIDYAADYIAAVPGVHVRRHERNAKPSLVVTLRPTQTPRIFLNAHLDVVPARAGQFQAEQRDGRIYGRGSQDMKGSGAVLLRLLKDMAALPEPPDVGFQFVSDEEIGGPDGVGYLVELGYSCAFFLAAEPTDLQICNTHKGMVWLEVTLPGDPTHGSMPWTGRNAILALRDDLHALEQRFPTLTAEAWRTTVTPTVVHGGNSTNRLPEQVRLSLDCRHIPEDDPEAIVAAVRECFQHGEVTVRGGGPPLQTSANDAFVMQLKETIARHTGTVPRLYGEHYGTDARYYSERGIPAVCLGPVGKGLHSDEEWVDVQSLVDLYHILHAFVTK